MTDSALGDNRCAASKSDGDGRRTEEQRVRDVASTSTRGPESCIDKIVRVCMRTAKTGTRSYLMRRLREATMKLLGVNQCTSHAYSIRDLCGRCRAQTRCKCICMLSIVGRSEKTLIM